MLSKTCSTVGGGIRREKNPSNSWHLGNLYKRLRWKGGFGWVFICKPLSGVSWIQIAFFPWFSSYVYVDFDGYPREKKRLVLEEVFGLKDDDRYKFPS